MTAISSATSRPPAPVAERAPPPPKPEARVERSPPPPPPERGSRLDTSA